jgi:hypothetical protein
LGRCIWKSTQEEVEEGAFDLGLEEQRIWIDGEEQRTLERC